jgi:hypothetical protein
MTSKFVALRRERVLSVSMEVRDLGPEAVLRYEAELTDFPALREVGRSPGRRSIASWAVTAVCSSGGGRRDP